MSWRFNRRILGNLLVVLGISLFLGAVGHIAIRFVLSADYLRARFADALGKASGGLYRFELGTASFSLVRNTMVATDVSIYPDTSSDSTRSRAPEGLYAVSAPSVRIEGANLLALMRGRIRARSLFLNGPHLHLSIDSRRARAREDSSGAEEEAPVPADTSKGISSFHLRLARQLPDMKIGNLRIEGAAFSWERVVDEAKVRDSVGNISVELRDIDTDSISAADTNRVLFSDDVRFRVASYARMSNDSLYVMSADSVSGSTKDAVLSLRRLQLAPIFSDSQLKLKQSHRTTRYRTTASAVDMRGIDFRNAFDASEVLVQSVVIRQPLLDVYLDRTRSKPGPTRAAVLPHSALRGISWTLRIDTIRVEGGRIIYAERAADGARPGRMRFEDVSGELRDLSNNGVEGSPRAAVDMRAKLNGSGTLVAHLEYDMFRRGLNMSFNGFVSGMDAASFNEMLIDVEGMKIESGKLDTAWFKVNVARDHATGTMQMNYHDLKVSFHNKQTLERGFLNRLKAFVANLTVVKGSNPPDEGKAATVAPIDIRRNPETPWFGFLWHSLRAGMLSTLGVKN